ncbi:MAG: hypothetical protein H6511_09605 [Holophagales bacterium]|nr:hypothetical protein [Holophagales bacterium]
MEFIAPMLVLITVALVIGSIARAIVVNRRLRENSRTWAEVQGKLIDKFGSADEVVRYLESDAHRELLSGQTAAPSSPHGRILDSVHLGLLVAAGGVGFLISGAVSDRQVSEVMRVFGALGLVIGIGFLVSAGISWALLRSWGLLPKNEANEVG